MNLRLPRVLLFLSGLIALPLSAADLKPSGKAPGSEFGGIVGCTVQYAHEDIWNNTASATGVLVPMVDEVVRGQNLDVMLAFGACANGPDGKAKVTYDVRVGRPDGTERVAAADLTAFDGRTPDPRMVLHPLESVRMVFGPEDPAGAYQFKVTLKDHVSHQQVSLGTTVRLLPDAPSKPLPTDFNELKLSDWLMHYYLKPDPRSALPVLLWTAQDDKMAKTPNAWPPFFGTYEFILRDNPWLVPAFKRALTDPATSLRERNTLISVLSYVFRHDASFAAGLPADLKKAFEANRRQPWPDPDSEILNPSQLDVLWGRFFATGELAPIKTLVDVMTRYSAYQGKFEEFKKLSPKPAQIPVEVTKSVIFRTALWSLRANAQQSALVRNYCGLLMEKTPESDHNTRLLLAMIVGAKVRTSDGKEIDLGKPPASAQPAPGKS